MRDIKLKISLNGAKQVNDDIDDLNGFLEITRSDARAAKAALDSIDRTRLGNLKNEASSLSASFASFAGNVAATALSFVTDKALDAGKALIDYSAKMQTTSIAFSVLLQSGEKAKTLLNDLKKFAAETPFEFPEIAQASKSLLAFGVAQEKIIPTLRNIGDIASGLGIPLTELAEIYGKARVQGRLFAEDVNQLTGRGIPIIQEFAKQFGVSESKVKDLVEQGKIGFPELEKAFENLTKSGGQFSGMMKAQSATFSGAWSSILDIITQSSATAFEPFFNEISDFSVKFANNLSSQEAQTKGVAFAFGKSIGESIKKGYNAGFSGVSTKDLLEFGAKVFTKGFGTAVTENLAEGIYEGLTEAKKIDNAIEGIGSRIEQLPSLSKQIDSKEAEKQAKAFSSLIDGLNDQLAFFGQTSEVAATKQKLINIGIYDFNDANAKTALSVASAIDKLKEAQEVTEKYNSELKSTRDELQKLRDKASFEINFPDNTELDKFDSFVSKQANNFKSLHSEIDLTRDALERAAALADVRKTTKLNSAELKRVSNEITDILNPDTSKLDSALRQISNNLGFKGIRLFDNSNIDGTDSVFSTQIQSFLKQYKEATSEFEKLGNKESFDKLNNIKLQWKNFLTSFQTDNGDSIIGDKSEVYEWINLFPKLSDAMQKVADTARDETFNGIVADLDTEIRSLNVQLGLSAELSKADAIAKELQKDAYKNLTPEMRETIQQKAAEIDQLKAAAKAQQEYKEAFDKTADIFEDALTDISERNWKGLWDSIFGEMKRFLIRAAAEFLASKFLKLITGQDSVFKTGNNSSGGGFGGIIKNLLGGFFGGNSGGVFGSFGGNNSAATPPFVSSNFSSNSSSGGNLPISPNNLMKFLTMQPNLPKSGVAGKTNQFANFFSMLSDSGIGQAGGFSIASSILPMLLNNTSPGKGLLGGIFGFALSFFNRGKLRKEEEKVRTQALVDAFDTLKQFDALIADVRSNPSNASSALSQGESLNSQVLAQYMQTVNALKDKKTRNIAIQDAQRVKDLSERKMAELRQVVEIAAGSADRDKQIIPEFASGNYFADFFKPNGLMPGIFDSKDDILAMISRGEMVLNPSQIANVIRNAGGRDVFAGANIPNYPTRPQVRQPKFETGAFIGNSPARNQSSSQPIQPNFKIVLEGAYFDEKTKAYLESDDGRRVQIETIKDLKKSGDI